MTDLFYWLALAGISVFAISGALLGLRNSMDVVGVSFIATVTGIGGGTIRDLLLGNTPVSWIQDPTPIVICVVSAVGVCILNTRLLGRRMQWLLYADAIGLSLFAVLGTYTAQLAGAHPVVAILLGAMSATFGGIIRDTICNEVPVILRREIYVLAALAGSTVFVFMPEEFGFDLRAICGISLGLALRLAAIRFEWSLPYPRYK